MGALEICLSVTFKDKDYTFIRRNPFYFRLISFKWKVNTTQL